MVSYTVPIILTSWLQLLFNAADLVVGQANGSDSLAAVGATGALRGLGVSLAPMIISVLGVCGIRLVWIYTVFEAYPTPDCLYLSYGVS